jgi:hypothetical protein
MRPRLGRVRLEGRRNPLDRPGFPLHDESDCRTTVERS